MHDGDLNHLNANFTGIYFHFVFNYDQWTKNRFGSNQQTLQQSIDNKYDDTKKSNHKKQSVYLDPTCCRNTMCHSVKLGDPDRQMMQMFVNDADNGSADDAARKQGTNTGKGSTGDEGAGSWAMEEQVANQWQWVEQWRHRRLSGGDAGSWVIKEEKTGL